MTKTGRPRIEINWDLIESLCQIQCTLREIAGVLGVSEDSIQRALKHEKKTTFAAYFDEKAASGRASLRRKQYEVAMAGNVTMLIWLGKQLLDQRDKAEVVQQNTGA